MTPQELKQTGEAMVAYATAQIEGKPLPEIQVSDARGLEKNQWFPIQAPAWDINRGCIYRLKPAPKLVPYTQETWPLGAWIKLPCGSFRFPISLAEDGLHFLDFSMPWGRLCNLEMSTDLGATWKPAAREVAE